MDDIFIADLSGSIFHHRLTSNTLMLAVINFVEQFRSVGVSLAVFFDGNSSPSKLDTLIERREQSIESCRLLYENLSSPTVLAEARRKYLPCLVMVAIKEALEETKTEMHFSVHEADRDIAIYSHQNRCFAVLSQDTDFLIFPHLERYIPLETLQFGRVGEISGECYSPERTAGLLRFKPQHLPLFASLVGNDYTCHHATFLHRKLGLVAKAKITEIVRGVARYLMSYDGSSEHLRSELFEGVSKAEADRIIAGLEASQRLYSLGEPETCSQPIDRPLLDAYVQGRLHHAALAVQELRDFKCPVVLEDPKLGMHSLNRVFSALRQRMYPLLYKIGSQGPPADSRLVAEYLQVGRKYKVLRVAVDSPALSCADLVSRAELALRHRTLLSLLEGDTPAILSLSPRLLSSALLLRYLLVHTTHPNLLLSESEVDAIIAMWLNLKDRRLHAPSLPLRYSRRSVHVGHLLQLAVWYLRLADEVCGLPLPFPAVGEWFHGPEWLWCLETARSSFEAALDAQPERIAAARALKAAALGGLPSSYPWRDGGASEYVTVQHAPTAPPETRPVVPASNQPKERPAVVAAPKAQSAPRELPKNRYALLSLVDD